MTSANGRTANAAGASGPPGARYDAPAADPPCAPEQARADARGRSRPRADVTRNHLLERVVKRRLEAARYRVEFRDDELYVDGVPVGTGTRLALARISRRADWARDDAAFAQLIETVLSDILVRQVRSSARSWDAAAVVEAAAQRRGLTIRRRGRAVAAVTASSFVTADGRRHHGPFWASGEHWRAALKMLAPGVAQPQTMTPTPTPTMQPPTAPARPTPRASSSHPGVASGRACRRRAGGSIPS